MPGAGAVHHIITGREQPQQRQLYITASTVPALWLYVVKETASITTRDVDKPRADVAD
jgi:hypothetical protein